jgi:hypothetical protein
MPRTVNERVAKVRNEQKAWLKEHAYSLSPEGLVGALLRGEGVLLWVSVPTKRGADLSKSGRVLPAKKSNRKSSAPA